MLSNFLLLRGGGAYSGGCPGNINDTVAGVTPINKQGNDFTNCL